MYLRIYVNDLLRTTGWAFVLLMMIIVLGSVIIAVSRNRSKGGRDERVRLETVSTEVEIPIQTSTDVSPWPSIDLHPMVAQMKAELARTMPVENVPHPKVEETPAQARNLFPAAESPTTPSTPATVIVGMMPVQKKARPEERPTSEEGSQPSA